MLSSGVVVLALLVGQPPVADDADMTIYRAAFDAVIKPEAVRLGGRPPSTLPPFVLYDRTIPTCTGSSSILLTAGCLGSELSVFEGLHPRQTTLPFGSAIGVATRAALATAFRQRNQLPHSLPDGVLLEAQTVPEPSPADAVRPARGVPFIRFSLPARSEDGFALVFASYTCGNLCAYGWLILLTETDGAWRVVDKHLAWIS
jgi:hypothetical protein